MRRSADTWELLPWRASSREMQEHQVAPGRAVYCQGDPADGLYFVRTGTAEMIVSTPAGDQQVSILEPPTCFGDIELLTGEERLSDVIARTPLTVWKLPRERFESLVDERPDVPRHIATDLATRLSQQTRALSESRQQITEAARDTYRLLKPALQPLFRRAALFERFDERLLRDLCDSLWSDRLFSELAQAHALVQRDDEGWFGFPTREVRDFLRHNSVRRLVTGFAQWQRRAADVLVARACVPPEQTMRALLSVEDWPRLVALLETRGAEVAEKYPEDVEGLICALPDDVRWSRPEVVRLLAQTRAAQGKLEGAVEAYQVAGRANTQLRAGVDGAAFQHELAGLYERLGDDDGRLACLKQLDALDETDVRVGVKGQDLPGDTIGAGERAGTSDPWHTRALSVVCEACTTCLGSWRWLGTLTVLAITAASWLLPSPARCQMRPSVSS